MQGQESSIPNQGTKILRAMWHGQKKKNGKENQVETLMGLCPVTVGKPAVFRNGESDEVSAVSSLLPPPPLWLTGGSHMCPPPPPRPLDLPDLLFPVTKVCSHAPGKCGVVRSTLDLQESCLEHHLYHLLTMSPWTHYLASPNLFPVCKVVVMMVPLPQGHRRD